MNTSSTSKQRVPLTLSELADSCWLANAESAWLEEQFERYQQDPSQMDASLSKLFEKLEQGGTWKDIAHHEPIIQRNHYSSSAPQEQTTSSNEHSATLASLVEAFRTYGHLQANIDPLKITQPLEVHQLTLRAHALDTIHQAVEFTLEGGKKFEKATPQQAFDRLKEIYCSSIGFEYQHITSSTEKNWLSREIEGYSAKNTARTKKRILHRLLESDGLEKHLASQFVGQKRFSIEGADSLMPMLDTLIIAAAVQKITDVNIGMAHRGRINVLINLLGKAPSDVFQEFLGKYDESDPLSGDVKYHKGFKSLLKTSEGSINAELAFNPSHLEIVAPVVQGINRAKQDQIENAKEAYTRVLPLLIHGDAAFAGQGVVMETFQLSQTLGYKTGGTIHVVLNNQVGFTTDPSQARSTRYCTDIGKMVETPIFHVNGNDPEAACRAMDLALAFRNAFHKDVIIDLVCYRRYGHNEADEPAATQPGMYQVIRAQKPVWAGYAEQLQKENIISEGEAQAWLSDYRKRVSVGEPVASLAITDYNNHSSATLSSDWRSSTNTQVALKTLKNFTDPLTQLPEGMTLQPQVNKLMIDRRKMFQGELALNWGAAETLAYASLLSEGVCIRLTGQDTERGTFAHRHSVLHDYQTYQQYTPLKSLTNSRQQFSIYDSILSEMATMGFEYGYAYAKENALVIWEAQYGDFVNGAQMIIDQFMSSGEQKWNQLSNLVLFLPHGYEGAGPEHSSARLERFLQLCAQDNIQVCIPTTPAQHFHLLRLQVLRKDFKKPLVIMTPKSLLRHKQAISDLSELSEGSFYPVIDVTNQANTKQVSRVILCSGKVYYDLLAAKSEENTFIAIIRLEQLYPFPDQELSKALKAYPRATEVIWCQEEPKNQGAWQWIHSYIADVLQAEQTLHYVGRKEAAATAVGSPLRHAKEQKELIEEALR